MADDHPRKETAAARLHRLLLKALPDDPRVATGAWGPAGAPYTFDTVGDQQRLRVANAKTGEVMAFVGATREALLTAFEQRLTPPEAAQ